MTIECFVCKADVTTKPYVALHGKVYCTKDYPGNIQNIKVRVPVHVRELQKNPFKSEKQRRYLWMHHPDIARKWTKKYGSKPKSTEYEYNFNVMARLEPPLTYALQSEYGLTPKYSLGEGAFGQAFVRSRGKGSRGHSIVVKLSSDNSEAESVAEIISSGFSHPNLAKYHSIEKIDDDYWVITMERAVGRKITSYWEESLLRWAEAYGEAGIFKSDEYLREMYNSISEGSRYSSVEEKPKPATFEEYRNIYYKYAYQVRSLYEAAKRLDPDIKMDIHSGNCLVDENYNLKFFDVLRTFLVGSPYKYIHGIKQWTSTRPIKYTPKFTPLLPGMPKVGDRVKIRSDLIAHERYGEDSFVDEMRPLLGKTVTVSEVFTHTKKFRILEDSGKGGRSYNWTPEMLERKIEIPADVVESMITEQNPFSRWHQC